MEHTNTASQPEQPVAGNQRRTPPRRRKGVAARFTRIDRRSKEVDQRLGALEEIAKEQGDRLEKVEIQLASAETAVAHMRSELRFFFGVLVALIIALLPAIKFILE